MHMNKRTFGIVAVALALGIGAGYWWASPDAGSSGQRRGQAVSKANKPLFYRNAMDPTVTSPVPAKDNMGMDYIPVYASDVAGGTGTPGTVVIDPTVVQNVGVRTAVATRKEISRTIQTVGRVAYDEDLLADLHPKVSGWIEKMFVSETGESVHPNTMLLSIYSPQLVVTEEEYLLALKNLETLTEKKAPANILDEARDLLRSSRTRLELLDVPEHQIRELTQTRKAEKALHIPSPVGGIVLEVGAREGQHVSPQTTLYRIGDLSTIWVYVDMYEYEIPWVRLNDGAEMRLTALPGRVFKGRIAYIYPYLDPRTRTNKIRLEFDNPDLLLKPDMFADVTLDASRTLNAIVIPASAVIRSGREPKVFVQTGEGTFEPRSVELGLEADGESEILSGVKEGERVVTSAQFLLDSESSLQEAAAKMVAPKPPAATRDSADMKAMKDMKPEPETVP